MINIEKLLDKCECMTLLCTRTATYWSYVKMAFNIPLVFTSSAMCIINSISTDANVVKIPNIVVNALSVLIMSLSNSIKSSEKFEIFKKLSQQFMLLSQELEALEPDDENIKEKLNIINLKYENLIQDCAFEDITQKNKTNVAKLFGDANRYLPIQLNGTSGNNIVIRQPKILTQKDVSLVTIDDSSVKNIKRTKANLDLEANLEV
tara:strand:+ start:507 stop:1124 length:618 start_codon:yes stop_codon:yes gene_type:complete